MLIHSLLTAWTRARQATSPDVVSMVREQVRPSAWGLRALAVARYELGKGESGGNNVGPDLDRYRGRPGMTGAWCADFVSHCLLESWQGDGPCPVKRSRGAKQLWRRAAAKGRILDLPQVGSLALWRRGQDGSWQGHIGIVSCVEIGRWWYVAGNEGRYPAVVAEHEGTDKPRLLGFARLPG